MQEEAVQSEHMRSKSKGRRFRHRTCMHVSIWFISSKQQGNHPFFATKRLKSISRIDIDSEAKLGYETAF